MKRTPPPATRTGSTDVRHVLCDLCGTWLYSVTMNGKLAAMGTDEDPAMHTRPIVVDVRCGERRYCFCSRVCAARWIMAQNDRDLTGGYPVL